VVRIGGAPCHRAADQHQPLVQPAPSIAQPHGVRKKAASVGPAPLPRAKTLHSRAGDVWDNSAMESFFSSLKAERTARRVYHSREQARSDVFDYIERF
jgi:hypothetical protein